MSNRKTLLIKVESTESVSHLLYTVVFEPLLIVFVHLQRNGQCVFFSHVLLGGQRLISLNDMQMSLKVVCNVFFAG